MWYDGVRFPLDRKRMEKQMKKLHLDLAGQLHYLRQAFIALSIEHRELLDVVIEMIDDRVKLLERYGDLCARVDENMKVFSADGLLADADGHGLSAMPLSVNRSGALPAPVYTFQVSDTMFKCDDANELQENLVLHKLITPPADGQPDDVIAIDFGLTKSTKKHPQPIFWLGQINQLHYLIELFYSERIFLNFREKKWEVTAQLFYPADRSRAAYTAKNICDAKNIKNSDRDAVYDALPRKWRRS